MINKAKEIFKKHLVTMNSVRCRVTPLRISFKRKTHWSLCPPEAEIALLPDTGLIFNGLTVVVSPLISLMKDQVEQLEEFGVPALFLNSSLSPEQYRQNVNRLRAGEAKLLYLAPETLMMETTRQLLSELTVDCFTIDEAHCISEWGHDFRPEYRQLAEVRKDFSDAVCIALTATATPRVRDDIQQILEMKDSGPVCGQFQQG
jgi:ATP-dependent DNA helicase RecQ